MAPATPLRAASLAKIREKKDGLGSDMMVGLLEVESSTVLIPASVRELPGSPLVTVDMGKPLSNLDVVGAGGERDRGAAEARVPPGGACRATLAR